MGQDKKRQLTQLLTFVKELYEHPDNKEFAAGIQELVLTDKEVIRRISGTADADAIRNIEKYLSLDFDLDSLELPDYSFVTDPAVRENLESDFREMMRYRFGTRGHRIDFAEFCRFATLQLEMIINYYYDMKYASDVRRLADAIAADNPRYRPGDYLSDISDIPLKTKVYRLRHEFKDINIFPILYCIEVRNRQSHRSLRPEKDKIAEYESRLKAGKVWNSRDEKPMYKKAVEQHILTPAELDEYSFQVWFDAYPFNDILASLKNLADLVRAAGSPSGTSSMN